jgi:cation:H+ antiporter
LFIVGLVSLVVGANMLVRGAGKLANRIGVSPLVIGLTVVAFGTSAPELSVSINAALSGNTDIAVGNAVGSNIFNVLFILGISALIAPLMVHTQIIRQEIPILIGACVLLFIFSVDLQISFTESAFLVTALILYTIYLVVQSRKESDLVQKEYPSIDNPASDWDQSIYIQLGLVLVGLVLLAQGADWLVESAVIIARLFGVSDIVIGLTIVAVGTSMPEVAASIMAALRGERDMAIGNVIGSNIFNILGSLGITGLIAADGITVPTSILNFDLWVMLAVCFACVPVCVTGREINRWEGGVFVGYYAVYVAYLILDSKDHDALGAYSTIMMSFVIPITLITLIALMIRSTSATGLNR